MTDHVIVIGAGVIGASIAWHLARRGVRVSVFDQGLPATAASGRSFGWLNASFYADAAHHHFRAASMAATRALMQELGTRAVRWAGCLDFELPRAELEARATTLESYGYPVQALEAADIQRRFPFLAKPPDFALFYSNEGAADLRELTADLLSAAAAKGAEVQTGCAVEAILQKGGKVQGVRTAAGDWLGDRVVVAAGTGSADLLSTVGVALPLLPRPGVIFETHPVEPVTDVVMVSPQMEFRQLPNGRFIAPTAAGHQGDTSDRLDRQPWTAALAAAARLNAMVTLPELHVVEASVGWRPVPKDGLPVIGPAGIEGLYVSVMHSGATLAAIAGQAVASEVTGGMVETLEPYRLTRFADT